MEVHALAQGEGVDGAVVRDRPVGGERRFDLQRAGGVADQPVIDVHQDAEVVHGGHGMGVERLRLGDLAHDEHAGRCLRLCRGQGAKRQRGRGGRRQQPAPGKGEQRHRGVLSDKNYHDELQ
jgi:hypothetical protein